MTHEQTMIGLERSCVVLVSHHRTWAEFFAGEAEALERTVGESVIAIEHVGSTAVLGLPAKPIIDIAVAVPSVEVIPTLSGKLSGLEYLDRGDAGGDGGHLFVRESAPGIRIIHLHMVTQTDPQWRRYLDFRDLLRNSSRAREQYAAWKGELAAKHRNDRQSYTEEKREIITNLLGGKA